MPRRTKPDRPGGRRYAAGSPRENSEDPIGIRILRRLPGVRVAQIRQAVRAAAGRTPIRQISVAVVDDRTIARLHARHLGDPAPTDVLSFDLRDDPGRPCLEGEVVVSAETALRQAHRLGLAPAEELLRYVIHGILHLCGYNDATPAQRQGMRTRENRILRLLRVSRESRSTGGPPHQTGPRSPR